MNPSPVASADRDFAEPLPQGLGNRSHEVRKLAEGIIAKGSKSFALASRILPPSVRLDAWLLYSWCRHADDAIDERPKSERAQALANLRLEVEALYGASPIEAPLWEALREVLKRRQIPRPYLSALLDGMQMDVEGYAYLTTSELLLYCHRVAGVVGLMMAHLLGVNDPSARQCAAQLGLGMQLTNICRDVLEDWNNGRLYLPEDLLARRGLSGLREKLGAPLSRTHAVELSQVVNDVLALAETYYRSSDLGTRALDARSAFAIRTARLVYAEIGRVVEAQHSNVFCGRAIVSGRRKVALLGKSLVQSLKEAPRRLRQPHVEVPLKDTLRFPEDILPKAYDS